MIRILILSPFQYVYGSKSQWVGVGESMYLDPTQDEGELKYLLSPLSEYRYWTHIEENEVTQKIKQDLEREISGAVLPATPVDRPEIPEVKVLPLDAPALEPEENIFIKETQEVKEIEEVVKEDDSEKATPKKRVKKSI